MKKELSMMEREETKKIAGGMAELPDEELD